MRRRLFGIMLACLLAVGLVPAAAFALGQGGESAPGDSAGAIETQSFATEHFPNYGFSDVDPGEWFANDNILGYALQHGLMRGYDESGMFGPYDPVTRGQVVTVLWRIAGAPEEYGYSFTDVPPDEFFSVPLSWASKAGIVQGYGDGTFRPYQSVTREELCKMLANFARIHAGIFTTTHGYLFAQMPDNYEVSEWARNEVAWCLNNHIITGVEVYQGGSVVRLIKPQDTADRSMFAKMVSVLDRDVLNEMAVPRFGLGSYIAGVNIPTGWFALDSADGYYPGYIEVYHAGADPDDAPLYAAYFGYRGYMKLEPGMRVGISGAVAVPYHRSSPASEIRGWGMYDVNYDLASGTYDIIPMADATSGPAKYGIATLPSELLAPESTAVQTFTQKVTVTLAYGQLLYLENALVVAKP